MDRDHDLRLSQLLIAEGEGLRRGGRERSSEALGAWSSTNDPLWSSEVSKDDYADPKPKRKSVRPISASGKPPSVRASQQSRPLSASLLRLPPKTRKHGEQKAPTPPVRTRDQVISGRAKVGDDLMIVAEKIGQSYGGVLHVSPEVKEKLERIQISAQPNAQASSQQLCTDDLTQEERYDGVTSPLTWGKRSEPQSNADYLRELQNSLSCAPFGTKILKISSTADRKLVSPEIHSDTGDENHAFVLAGSIAPSGGFAPSFAELGSPKAPEQPSRHHKGPKTTPSISAPKFLVGGNTQRPSSATGAIREQRGSTGQTSQGSFGAKRPSSATPAKRSLIATPVKRPASARPQMRYPRNPTSTASQALAREWQTDHVIVNVNVDELALSSRKEAVHSRRPQSAPLHRQQVAATEPHILQDDEEADGDNSKNDEALRVTVRHVVFFPSQSEVENRDPARIQTRPESAPPSRNVEPDEFSLQTAQQRAAERLRASQAKERPRPASAAPKSQLDETAANAPRPRSAPPKQYPPLASNSNHCGKVRAVRRVKQMPAWAVQREPEQKVSAPEGKLWKPISLQEETRLREASLKARNAMLLALQNSFSVWQDPARRQQRITLLKQLDENQRQKRESMDMGGWRMQDVMEDLQTVDAPVIKSTENTMNWARTKHVNIAEQDHQASEESRKDPDEDAYDVEVPSATDTAPGSSHARQRRALLSYVLHPASAIATMRPDKERQVAPVPAPDIVEAEPAEQEQEAPSSVPKPTQNPQFEVVEAFSELIKANREQDGQEHSDADIKPRKKVVINDVVSLDFIPGRIARAVGDGEEKTLLRSETAALSSSQVVHDLEYAHERRGGANSLCGPTTPNFKPYKPEGIELKRWVKEFVMVQYKEESQDVSLPFKENSQYRSKEEFVNAPYQIDYILDLSKTAVDISNQGSFSKAVIVVVLTVRGGDAKVEARFQGYDPKRKAHWEGSPFFGKPADVGFEDEGEDFDWMSVITINPKNDQYYKTGRERTKFLHFVVKGLHGHGHCTLRAAMVRTNAYEEHRLQKGLVNTVGKHNPNEVVFKHLLQNQALQQSEIRKRIVRAGGSIDKKLGVLAWHSASYHAQSDSSAAESRLRDSLIRSTIPTPTDGLSLRWHAQQQRRGKAAPRTEGEYKSEINFIFKDRHVVAESVPSSSLSDQSIDVDDPERAESDMFDAWCNFILANNSVHYGERSKVLNLAELFRLLFLLELVGSPDWKKNGVVPGAKVVIPNADVMYVFSKTKRFAGNHSCIDFEGFVSFMRRCAKRTSKTVHQLMHAYRRNQRSSNPSTQQDQLPIAASQNSQIRRVHSQGEAQHVASVASQHSVGGVPLVRTATKDEREHACWLGNILPNPSPAELSQFNMPPVVSVWRVLRVGLPCLGLM